MHSDAAGVTTCPRPTCYAPEAICVLGLEPCPHFAAAAVDGAEADSTPAGRPLPWSGLAMGTADIAAIAACARTVVIGVVGPANSGKTTLLAAHWLTARRGGGEYGRRFAGSYSLLGWHQIARHLQWAPHGRGFPPHTTAADARTPALLHTMVTDVPGGRCNVLFTDVPGEWFTTWAYDETASPGAQWIADQASAFVLLADGEALAGEDRGRARGDHDALADRLASAAGERSVVPVQTKADHRIPDAISEHLDQMHQRSFGMATMRVSVHDGTHDPVTAPLDAAVAWALRPTPVPQPSEGSRDGDPLLAYRSYAWK